MASRGASAICTEIAVESATECASGSATCSRYRSATVAAGLDDASIGGFVGNTDAVGDALAVPAAVDAVDAALPQPAETHRGARDRHDTDGQPWIGDSLRDSGGAGGSSRDRVEDARRAKALHVGIARSRGDEPAEGCPILDTSSPPAASRRRRVTRWIEREWSGRRGSNSRHQAWKASALPTELLPQAQDAITMTPSRAFSGRKPPWISACGSPPFERDTRRCKRGLEGGTE